MTKEAEKDSLGLLTAIDCYWNQASHFTVVLPQRQQRKKLVQCLVLRPKLQRFTESHQIYCARMCHFKDSMEEKGSFDEKDEITLFPQQYILCCRLRRKCTLSNVRVLSCDWYFSTVSMLLLAQLYICWRKRLCIFFRKL